MAKLDSNPSEMGMRTEQLTGRTQQVFFSVQESDNLTYPWAPEVDFDKHAEVDAENSSATQINLRISWYIYFTFRNISQLTTDF